MRRPLLLLTDDVDATPALARAVSMAAAGGSGLTVLQAVRAVPPGLRLFLPPEVLAELKADLRRRQDAALAGAREAAEAAGVRVRTLQREGDPFLVAIREVLASGHDLLVKTAGGEADGTRVFGSTDKHLLRKCPCAVWLVMPSAPRVHRRIVAAVDPDPSYPEQQALSAAVLRAGAQVARADGCALDVLHGWGLFGEDLLRGPDVPISDPEVDHLVGNALNRHGKCLDDLLAAHPDLGVEVRRHLLRGRAAKVIPQFARESGASLLVMGTVGRTGVPGLLIGNTAERVIDAVDCSILALKPAGFVSPVTS